MIWLEVKGAISGAGATTSARIRIRWAERAVSGEPQIPCQRRALPGRALVGLVEAFAALFLAADFGCLEALAQLRHQLVGVVRAHRHRQARGLGRLAALLVGGEILRRLVAALAVGLAGLVRQRPAQAAALVADLVRERLTAPKRGPLDALLRQRVGRAPGQRPVPSCPSSPPPCLLQ